MLLPELPSYLSSLGGGEYKGLIIALFTVTAGLSRPFSGKLTDIVGRIPIMAVGSIVCFICGFLYPILTSISGFLFLRLIHGFSTGFKPTATAAYVADIIPKERWGEALGIHGLCFSTGMAIGPAIGSTITLYYSINALFYCSSAFALLSILILMRMKETLPHKQSFKLSHFKINKSDILNKQVMPVFWITLLTYSSYGALVTLIPDWSSSLGLKNKGLFFMIFTISSLLMRFIAGKSSDKYGREVVIKISLIVYVIAFLILAYSHTTFYLFIGAILYGFAVGIFSPAISAWAIDLSDDDKRGKSVATMYIGLEAGIGIGAFLAGLYYRDAVINIPYIFYVAAFINLVSLLFMLNFEKQNLTTR